MLTLLGVFSLLVLAYSVLIVRQALLGVFVVLAIAVVYLFFVFVQVFDRIATALEDIAEQGPRDERD